jgi:hypothetical protein
MFKISDTANTLNILKDGVYMNSLREFLGMNKEAYAWDKQDLKIVFISIFLYLALAVAPFVTKSELANKEAMKLNLMASALFVFLAFISFIFFIILSIKTAKA